MLKAFTELKLKQKYSFIDQDMPFIDQERLRELANTLNPSQVLASLHIGPLQHTVSHGLRKRKKNNVSS